MSDVASLHQSPFPALPGPIRTVPALIQSIEGMFHCVQGPPRAYFEMRTASAPDAPIMRVVYSTLKFKARGRRADMESMLVQAMEDEFKALLAQYVARFNALEEIQDGIKPFLFWRRIPDIEELEPLAPGIDPDSDTWTEGRPYSQTTLRCRFAVPGLDHWNESGLETTFLREVR